MIKIFTPLKTFLMKQPQKLLKLLRTIFAYASSHSFLIPLLASLFKKLFQKIRRRHLISVLVSLILFNGGCYFWKIKQPYSLPPTQEGASLPKEIHKITERTEEKEAENEDDMAHEKSPWTLLQTALPSHYSHSAFKKKPPAVAFILTGLGLNKDWTIEALATLRGDITVALSPYSQNVGDQLSQVQQMGYHGVIGLPLEPYDYPNPDPGPLTILTGAPPEDNRHKTRIVLEKTPKGTGVMGEYGSRFTISEAELEPVLRQIRNHEGDFIDPRTSLYSKVPKICHVLGMNCHQVDLTLPLNTNLEEADEFLKKIIQNATENGTVIVCVPAIPAFINHLVNWIDTLEEEGIDLITIAELTNSTPSEESKSTENADGHLLHQPR